VNQCGHERGQGEWGLNRTSTNVKCRSETRNILNFEDTHTPSSTDGRIVLRLLETQNILCFGRLRDDPDVRERGGGRGIFKTDEVRS